MIRPSQVDPSDRQVWDALAVDLAWHERLYAFAVGDAVAAVLIDTNSDGREIVLIVYAATGGGSWEPMDEQDDVVDPGTGELSGYGWAVGRSTPQSSVIVSYNDAEHRCRTNRHGWWAFADPRIPSDVAPIRVD